MTLRRTLFVGCLSVCTLCLAGGYGVAGLWIGAAASILIIPGWLLARKYPASWVPLLCLLASVGLAALGRLLGAAGLLMICAAGLSLTVWDLLLLNDALGNNPSGKQTQQYETKHLQTLALCVGSGLLVALLGRLLNFRIPFLILLIFVAVAIFGLDRAWGYIRKNEQAGKIGPKSYR